MRSYTFKMFGNTERLFRSTNHTDLAIVSVQAHNVSTLLSLSPKLPTLKIIVAIDEISAAPKESVDVWSQQRKIRVMTLAECKCFFTSLKTELTL